MSKTNETLRRIYADLEEEVGRKNYQVILRHHEITYLVEMIERKVQKEKKDLTQSNKEFLTDILNHLQCGPEVEL